MSAEKVKAFLAARHLQERYLHFPVSSATVDLAARAIGCAPQYIVKTLAFKTRLGPVVVCLSGARRIDNRKFKAFFKEKPSFPHADEVYALTGHPAGGVCPFALNEGVRVYLDESLLPLEVVYPAAGTADNAVRLTPQELQSLTGAPWIDVSTPCGK